MKRLTILTGAGFTSSDDFAKISTASITEELINYSNVEFFGQDFYPGEFIYKTILEHYKCKAFPINPKPYAYINFETMIYFLEELYSFIQSTFGYNGINPSYSSIKSDIINYIDSSITKAELFKTTKSKDRAAWIELVYREFIQHIIDKFKFFCNDQSNKGMNLFVTTFYNNYLKDQTITRIYTLNYDIWLNKYAGFYDGFNYKTGDLEFDKVMNSFDFDCHYNLHGCIYWMLHYSDIIKFEHPVDFRYNSRVEQENINREPILGSPIITGYNKTQRIFNSPYLQFSYTFQNDLLNSEYLLIIGYSFSDPHINSIISNFQGNIIIVSYVDSVFRDYGDLIDFPDDGKIGYSKWPWKIHNLKKEDFEIFDNYIVFKNRIKYWWKGIGENFYDNWESMIKSN